MGMQFVDLNADMGEGFGPWTFGDGVDERIMPMLSSANVAAGFHAGDPNIMARTVEIAKEHGVRIGAHPGFRDLVGFGRRHILETPQALVNDLLYQLGALRELAHNAGLSLQHVKPHGALYMHVAKDEALSRLLVETLHRTNPDLILFCMESSATYRIAKEYGHPVAREFYADREYDRTGSIVFTRNVRAYDANQVADKVLRACVDGKVETVEGDVIDVDFDSICIHSDTPGALGIVSKTHEALVKSGIKIVAPSASAR